MILIAEELGGSLTRLPEYDSHFATGDMGELRLYLDSPLSQEEISQLERAILSQGVVLTAPIVQDAQILVIKFKKTVASLATLVDGISANLQGWQLFKSESSIPLWALLTGGIALGYFILRPKRVR